MTILNQILFFGAPRTGKLRIIKHVFKSLPDIIPEDSHSGLIHKGKISTAYYETEVGIWVDDTQERGEFIGPNGEELSKWADHLKSEEAKEIREVINGLIFTFNIHDDVEYIRRGAEIFSELIEQFRQEIDVEAIQWQGITVAVGTKREDELNITEDKKLEIEDLFIENGIEFVNFEDDGKNEYMELTGKSRFHEILQTHDWTDIDILEKETKDVEKDLDSLSTGLLTGNPLGLDQIIEKLQRAKIDTSNLPQNEREAYAKKIIDDLMDYI